MMEAAFVHAFKAVSVWMMRRAVIFFFTLFYATVTVPKVRALFFILLACPVYQAHLGGSGTPSPCTRNNARRFS